MQNPTDAAAVSVASLRVDLLYGGQDRVQSEWTTEGRSVRSVPLAFVLSAAVPGLGQAYNRSWIKTAVAVAIESAVLVGYFSYRSRGLDGEEAYQDYAHAYWSAARYAGWLNDYVEFLRQDHGASIDAEPIAVPAGIDFSSPSSWSDQERRVVGELFVQIRGVEARVFHPETDASFSHKLPNFAEQQYYELIGKYFQFAPGWEDYPAWREGDEFTPAIDPELTGPGGSKPNVTGRFVEYARDHATANDLLRRASRLSAVLILNHVVAAFDAAFTAKLHNSRLRSDIEVSYDALGRHQTTASLRWRF